MCSPRGRSWRATCSARATLRASACPSARPSGASRARRPHAVSAPSATRLEALVAEAQRVLTICNACRYCEGYCAVFPALERRLDFAEADVHYLANLCHNCGSCLYACQYAPPHEFQLNFPRMLAEVRLATYRKYALPGVLFARSAILVTLVSLLVLFFLVVTKASGTFYDAMPHSLMAGFFGIVSLLVLVPLVAGGLRFWRDMHERAAGGAVEGARDALTLKYLGGGGE